MGWREFSNENGPCHANDAKNDHMPLVQLAPELATFPRILAFEQLVLANDETLFARDREMHTILLSMLGYLRFHLEAQNIGCFSCYTVIGCQFLFLDAVEGNEMI